MKRFYQSCGLLFLSEFELPGFDELGQARDVDVLIRRGKVPLRLLRASYRHENYDAGSGVTLLRTNGARFLVRSGQEIVADSIDGMSSAAIATYLSGSVMAALLHQRGLLPLHAGTVVYDKRAIAFVGRSGAGKSTLMGALEARGFAVLSEDVTATVVPGGQGPVQTAPGIRRLKLNSDSAFALGFDTANATVAENTGKHLWFRARTESMDWVPLVRLYVLDPAFDWRVAPQCLSGLERLEVLRQHTHRWGMAVAMGCGIANMKMRLSLADWLPTFRLGRPSRWEDLPDWLCRVDEHIRQIEHGV